MVEDGCGGVVLRVGGFRGCGGGHHRPYKVARGGGGGKR
jgi:hypothetical protein